MDIHLKYFSDYIKFLLSNAIISGTKNYEKLRAEDYKLKEVKIENKLLAKELENACRTNGGFLTYAEFLVIDQFGKNGYHANHKVHGITPTHESWGKAISELCKKNDISSVIEFGPGAGDLALEIFKASKNTKQKINWSGVELNPELIKSIKFNFKQNGLTSNLDQLVDDLEKLKYRKKALIVFSYSLDSIPPQIFINTRNRKSVPDSIMGVTIKDGVLKEFLMTEEDLIKKGISFKNGVYKEKGCIGFNLSPWKIHPGQRAYINVVSFSILYKFTKLFSDSMFLIIDEFRFPSSPWDRGYLCVPKDLHRFKRDLNKLESAYKESGSNILYYPTYLLTFYKLLNGLGFSSVNYEVEKKMAKDIVGENWRHIKDVYLTYAFLASNKRESRDPLLVEFPQQKLI